MFTAYNGITFNNETRIKLSKTNHSNFLAVNSIWQERKDFPSGITAVYCIQIAVINKTSYLLPGELDCFYNSKQSMLILGYGNSAGTALSSVLSHFSVPRHSPRSWQDRDPPGHPSFPCTTPAHPRPPASRTARLKVKELIVSRVVCPYWPVLKESSSGSAAS